MTTNHRYPRLPIVRLIRPEIVEYPEQGECPLCAVDYGAESLGELAEYLGQHLADQHGADGATVARFTAALIVDDDDTAQSIATELDPVATATVRMVAEVGDVLAQTLDELADSIQTYRDDMPAADHDRVALLAEDLLSTLIVTVDQRIADWCSDNGV